MLLILPSLRLPAVTKVTHSGSHAGRLVDPGRALDTEHLPAAMSFAARNR